MHRWSENPAHAGRRRQAWKRAGRRKPAVPPDSRSIFEFPWQGFQGFSVVGWRRIRARRHPFSSHDTETRSHFLMPGSSAPAFSSLQP